ncbi:MAG: glycine--tRNA ligase subunit beta, partial [Pseudomonadota bacterium]
VAAAAEDHYSPLGPSDAVPTAPVSVAVALADKLDMLAAFWAIDEKPTGSKDPFALRRAALGVIRLILENDLRIALQPLLIKSFSPFGEMADVTTAADLLSFVHDRLKVLLRDRGVRHDIIDACLDRPGSDDLTSLVKRAEALESVLKTDDGENLLQGFKRANNILTQAEEKDGVEYSFGADVRFVKDPSETALFEALDAADAAIAPALAKEDYEAAMAAMAGLRAPVDAFFEAVQVNTDNQTLRRNRLNLLSRIRSVCGSVADLTRLDR